MTADLACHVAKEQGRSRIRFELFLQPVFPVSDESGLPMMNEFLIRLRGEDGRMLAPGLFIPSAERYGLMWQIDRWMVENAIAYLKDVETEREALYTINLSAQTFGDRAFAEFVEMTLESYGVDAGRVCFELTETAAITNIANASELMMALKDLGCSILLDDFGSGLSSFGYLKNLPIDYLKIDGQFVRDLTTDPLDEVMVRMCQELAKGDPRSGEGHWGRLCTRLSPGATTAGRAAGGRKAGGRLGARRSQYLRSDVGRDLLDGDGGGVDERDAMPTEQCLGLVDLPLALFECRVPARRAALAADPLQLQGIDGEPYQLFPVGCNGIRQFLPFQILPHQRIVGGL